MASEIPEASFIVRFGTVEFNIMTPRELDVDKRYSEPSCAPLENEHIVETQKMMFEAVHYACSRLFRGNGDPYIHIVFRDNIPTEKMMSIRSQILMFILFSIEYYGRDTMTHVLAKTPEGHPILIIVNNSKYTKETLDKLKVGKIY